ncbi:unnamed protein product [Candidula unifasciata]|uniref:Bifunctional apoptosis regulator n=1 Tax=Candidula unifasciata TaxID=100452 RepID=A0A8S4A1P5_9EUPU|nr:unnamed protein product [Candidula unifasciata]
MNNTDSPALGNMQETDAASEGCSVPTLDQASVNAKVSDHSVSADVAEEFTCSVCFLLLVQPTTLTCGHTLCRDCLARWYFTSLRKTCPLCNQSFQGHPLINTSIRNMITKMFPLQLEEREKELAKHHSNITKFDKELMQETNHKPDEAQGGGGCGSFCAGAALVICAFLIAYIAWYWQHSATNLLVLKPVQFWRSQDVVLWLEDMPWASSYANMSRENSIDGNMLLSMDGESLTQLLNVTDATHRRALLFAINRLKHEGVKVPSSLWEYKALYPAQCQFLVHGMKGFPRTALFYMWMYYYDELFLPFAMATIPSVSHEGNVSIPLIPEQGLSMSQWTSFIFYAVVLPHWLVVLLAYQMFSHYFITPIIVIGTAAMYQVWEIVEWIILYKQCLSTYLKLYVKQMMQLVIFMVIWPVIPWFICDAIFYISLYLWPFYAFQFALYHLKVLINL